MGVTVVINNRDLLSWPRAMVDQICTYDYLAEVLILDNGSSYEPLLDWYQEIPHRAIKLPNIGHTAAWVPEINALIKTDYYVVSDPDMDLSGTPRDTLKHLADQLLSYKQFEKIGLGLDIKSVPKAAPLYEHVNSYEKKFWELPLMPGGVRSAVVDTTFAMYHKGIMNHYKITGLRTDYPYVAKHIPWCLIDRPEEFNYYLAHANDSSCYKVYLNL